MVYLVPKINKKIEREAHTSDGESLDDTGRIDIDADDTREIIIRRNVPDVVLGIDLGTTNSSAAYFSVQSRKPVPLNLESDGIPTRIPSVVWYDQESDRMMVGAAARRAAALHPHAVRAEFKRDMPHSRPTSYTLGVGDGARTETPESLSAVLLAEIKRRAEQSYERDTGTPVQFQRVVITVPAGFPEPATAATEAAAITAGFTGVQLLDEPTAAGLAYALTRGEERTQIVVFDFGGGTLDCNVLTTPGEGTQPFTVGSPAGDPQLGGKDFDTVVVDLLAERVQTASRTPDDGVPFDVRSDGDIGINKNKRILWRNKLKEQAEIVKIQLTSSETAYFSIDSEELVDSDGLPLAVSGDITREEFEAASAGLVQRAMVVLRQALTEAKLDPGDIDRLVLVGGTTLIPAVARALFDEFGIQPYGDIDRLTAVAQGAAIYGFLNDGSGSEEDGIAVAASHYFGVRVGLDQVETLIAKNTRLPAGPVSQSYVPHISGTTEAVVTLCQYDQEVYERTAGSSLSRLQDDDFASHPQRAFELGQVRVTGLTGESQAIEVTFEMSTSRVLDVKVKRVSDSFEFPVKIERHR